MEKFENILGDSIGFCIFPRPVGEKGGMLWMNEDQIDIRKTQRSKFIRLRNPPNDVLKIFNKQMHQGLNFSLLKDLRLPINQLHIMKTMPVKTLFLLLFGPAILLVSAKINLSLRALLADANVALPSGLDSCFGLV